MMNDLRGLWRGKSAANGEWIEGNYFKTQVNQNIIHCIIPFSKFINVFPENGIYQVVPETLCRYTGISDKSGVKVFEGDIVTGIAYSMEWRGVIVWISEIAGFGVRYWRREDPTAWENSSILKQMTRGRKDEFAAEVIGNIYDNPGLLFATGADEGNAAKDCLLSAT